MKTQLEELSENIRPTQSITASERSVDVGLLNNFEYLFVIFWIASLLGHYLEVLWSYFNHLVLGSPLWLPTVKTLIPIAIPYGLGAIAVVHLVWPFIRDRKINRFHALLACIFIAGFVEYFSAVFLVIFSDHNLFWNYSSRPLNISGYVCLESSTVFGIISVLFLYFIYPSIKRFIEKFKQRQLSFVFWVLLISTIVDLTYSFLIRH